jgi:hypothetical protein
MNIHCSIQTTADDSLSLTPDKAAAAVLKALGGNPKSDLCFVSIQAPPDTGSAGAVPDLTVELTHTPGEGE